MKATITRPDGTRVDVEGTAAEVAEALDRLQPCRFHPGPAPAPLPFVGPTLAPIPGLVPASPTWAPVLPNLTITCNATSDEGTIRAAVAEAISDAFACECVTKN